MEQILGQALELSPEERAMLADRLVESLDPSEAHPFHQQWVDVVRRRVDEVRSGKAQTIPGDEALARVRKAIGMP